MEPYAKITIYKEESCHKLSCVINNTNLSPLKWMMFVKELDRTIKLIGNDPKIDKFYMYYDVTQLDVLMNQNNYKDIVEIFKNNFDLFIHKLLGTFIYIENNIFHVLLRLLIKFYTPTKPLFILKESVIEQEIIDDLLNNRKNINEYSMD